MLAAQAKTEVTSRNGDEVIQPARHTTRTMLAVEAPMDDTAQQMAASQSHWVSGRNVDESLKPHGSER
jgi:hypothetical protein